MALWCFLRYSKSEARTHLVVTSPWQNPIADIMIVTQDITVAKPKDERMVYISFPFGVSE